MGVQDAYTPPDRGLPVANNANATRAYGQQYTEHPQMDGPRRHPSAASHTVDITSSAMPAAAGPSRKRRAPTIVDLTGDSPPETPTSKRSRADRHIKEPSLHHNTSEGKNPQTEDDGDESPKKKAKKDDGASTRLVRTARSVNVR
jgi:hypothetical protein